MRTSLAAVLGICVVASAGFVQGQGQAPAPWKFVAHEIATGLRGGYQVVAVDMNKDGKIDLLAVATSATADLVWFENPTWARHVVASGLPAMINADAFDIDGDGIPEIALASGFTTAPARSAPGASETWVKEVLETKSMAAAGCALAHFNSDARLDLACIGTATANLKWYENVATQ